MIEFKDRIDQIDLSLFQAITSETDDDDKTSVLVLQQCARSLGEYSYLEVGSHLGGTIQPHYADPCCKRIYSIDPRPFIVADQRGRSFEYPENSTAHMLDNLKKAFPAINPSKVTTFDLDARDVKTEDVTERPNLCFIDGEHTNQAVYSDFENCLRLCDKNAIIGFHDTKFIFGGLQQIKALLHAKGMRFHATLMRGSVYVILLNEAVDLFASKIKSFCSDEDAYIKKYSKELARERMLNTIIPVDYLREHNQFLFKSLRGVKRLGLRIIGRYP